MVSEAHEVFAPLGIEFVCIGLTVPGGETVNSASLPGSVRLVIETFRAKQLMAVSLASRRSAPRTGDEVHMASRTSGQLHENVFAGCAAFGFQEFPKELAHALEVFLAEDAVIFAAGTNRLGLRELERESAATKTLTSRHSSPRRLISCFSFWIRAAHERAQKRR